MSNYSIQLNGPISVFDLNGNLVSSLTLTNIKTPVNSYAQGSISVSAAAAAITLPAAQTNFIYIQNIGTATAVVSLTPNGGSGVIFQNLTVSSAAMVIQSGSASNTGVSAITVSSAAAATLNYLLGG